jgi:hypothetical protein
MAWEMTLIIKTVASHDRSIRASGPLGPSGFVGFYSRAVDSGLSFSCVCPIRPRQTAAGRLCALHVVYRVMSRFFPRHFVRLLF